MANKSSRSPARNGLVGATAVFGLLTLIGIGWVLREGRLGDVRAEFARWTTAMLDTKATAGHGNEVLDAQTQAYADRGATVAIGVFPDANHVQLGQTVFRYWGVTASDDFALCQDNPNQWPCGTRALEALTSIAKSGLVACFDRGTSSAGERLGQCFHGGVDLGGMLVENGFAREVPEETPNYHVLEAIARSHGMGQWSTSP